MIDDDLDKSLSVGELAAMVHWSESSLSHRFHEQIGMSVMHYRTDRRLQQAARLLTTTHYTVRQIAYSVAYRSLSLADFRRDFRKRFGMSPRTYRAHFWRGPIPPR